MTDKKDLYTVEGDKIVRKNPFCPRCGEGVFMADHGLFLLFVFYIYTDFLFFVLFYFLFYIYTDFLFFVLFYFIFSDFLFLK